MKKALASCCQFFNRIFILLLIVSGSLWLSGCAASDVSRTAASNIDLGVQNAQNMFDGVGDSDFNESVQNSSQLAKGAVMGGIAGALIGAFYSSSIGALPGAATGLILGASYGMYIDTQTNTLDQLENRGVNTIVLGDQVLIVIPSAHIFNPNTSTIKPQAYSTLNLVTRYINCFRKMLVKVSAYTNNSGACEVDLALSKAQAEKVARYFLASGIDARILYAVGCGGTHLVDNTSENWAQNDNYRIEITLQRLHV